MKKADFIEKLSEKIEMNKKETLAVYEAFLEMIVEGVKSGDEIVFPEMGKFGLKKRPARTARNPLTGKTVEVAAKVVPQFKPNKKFKEAVAS